MSTFAQSEDQHTPLVAPLAYFGRTNLSLAGGKGANLGELLQAGFDVPPGFVITTGAYDLLLQRNDLQTQLRDLLAALEPDDPNSVAATSEKIRQAFQQASIPASLTEEVLNAYRQLG